MVKLYVLGNRETGLHFSPYAWRAIMALKHKKIEFDMEILSLEEVGPKITELTDGKWRLVPLIQFDDGSYTYESFEIAVELEKRYPNQPKLFPAGLSNAKFYEAYFMAQLIPVFKRVILHMYKCFSKEDQVYFRKTREASFKRTLEEFAGDADSHLQAADISFDPLRAALKHASFIEGAQPTYSDYIFMSGFLWIKITTPEEFALYITNHKDSILKKWYHAVDKHFEGYLENTKTIKDV